MGETAYVVFTYDNMDAVAAVLNGIASIMGSTAVGFRDMVRLIGTLGLLVALTSFLLNPTRMAAFSWMGGFIFVYLLLFLPVTRVNVVDVLRVGHARTVDNVPAALALTASVTSTVGWRITRAFENVMQALPVALGDEGATSATCGTSGHDRCMFRFSQGGFMFANKLLGRIEQTAREAAAAVDPKLQRDMFEFLSQCTAYDLTQRRLDYERVSKATDLWAAIANTSPARYVMENEKFKDCAEAYASLTQRRDRLGDRLEVVLARSVFPNLPDADARSLVNNSYKDVAAATSVGNAAWEVKSFLLQNMTINQAKRGLGRMGMESGSPSAIMLGQAEATTIAATNANFITQSRLAEEALPLIRNGIEAILYGIFPIAVLIMMTQTGAALVTTIKGFVFAFIWIQLWPPLYALVNYIGQVRSMQTLRSIATAMRDMPADAVGVAFSNYNSIYNGQLSDQAVMGYLIIAVPVIASGIIYGMNSAMGAIGGGTFLGSAGRAAEAVGSGNVSMGNVSLGQQTLGPSRVDPDVFSHTTTGGSFKYALTPTGQEYSSGQFSSTSAPFSISVDSQHVGKLKSENAVALESAQKSLETQSRETYSDYSKKLSEDKEFQKFIEGRTAYSFKDGTSSGSDYRNGSAFTYTGSGKTAYINQNSDNTTVSHDMKAAPQLSGMGGGRTDSLSGGTANTSQSGHEVLRAGQRATMAADQIADMRAYEALKQHTSGDQATLKASRQESVALTERASAVESLSNEIAHRDQLKKSLETMDSRGASFARDLTHDAVKAANKAEGKHNYVEGLETTEEKVQAIMPFAVKNLVENYGFTQQEAQRLLGDQKGSYLNQENIQIADPNKDRTLVTPQQHFDQNRAALHQTISPDQSPSNGGVPNLVTAMQTHLRQTLSVGSQATHGAAGGMQSNAEAGSVAGSNYVAAQQITLQQRSGAESALASVGNLAVQTVAGAENLVIKPAYNAVKQGAEALGATGVPDYIPVTLSILDAAKVHAEPSQLKDKK